MPTNKNAMTRYKILDELLSNRYHNYSLDDLTEEVNARLSELYPDTNGVGRRMIEKDIHYLEYEGPFLADIERYTVSAYSPQKQKSYAKQCLRYARPGYSIFHKDMSDDEEYLLREALSLLGQFDGLPNLDGLEGLRLGLGVHRDGQQIISFTKNPIENSNLLGEIFTAISQEQVIDLRYHTFAAPSNVKQINLFPYLLKEYNRRWFLIGATEQNTGVMTFALDRIDSVMPLPSHTYIKYKGDINELFEHIIGVSWHNSYPMHHICFWVSDKSKDYVATKPLHKSQHNVDEHEEQELRKRFPTLHRGRFFRMDCKENYELLRELTSFGKDLLVLEPTDLQDKIFRQISEIKQDYANLRT